MSIEIETDFEGDFARLVCSGICTPAEVKKVYVRVVDAVIRHERHRVLVDALAVTGDLSAAERYETSEFLAHEFQQRSPGIPARIAIVGNEPPLEPGRLGQTVALNRGVNLKVTTDLDEALAWLNA